MPESEALASTVWRLAASESRLCHLALMYLVLNQRNMAGGAESLIQVCGRLMESDLAGEAVSEGTNDSESYGKLVEMARSVLLGELVDPTFGAWRAHRHSVSPTWSEHLAPTALIGPYLFYAPKLFPEEGNIAGAQALG